MTKKMIMVVTLLMFFGTNYAQAVVAPGLGANENSQDTQTQANLSTGTAGSVKKCEQLKARITQRIRNFDDNRNRHLESYQKIVEKIDDLMDRLEVKGYDTGTVSQKLTAFNQLMLEYRNSYAVYQQNLSDAKNIACDADQAKFAGSLKQTRNQLKIVQKNHTAIHTFWANELRPVIIALKLQNREAVDETTETEEGTTTAETGGE